MSETPAGNMTTYLTSYIRNRVDGVTSYEDTVWLTAALAVCLGLFMYWGGVLERKVGVRLCCSIGCAIESLGVMSTYFVIDLNFIAPILTFGIIAGIGVSLAYIAPLDMAHKWYPNKKGLVSGVIVGGFGMGAFIFNQVQTMYMNPENLKVDEDKYFSDARVLDRVPSVFLVLGAIYICLQFIGICLMAEPPVQTPSPQQVPLKKNKDTSNEDGEEVDENGHLENGDTAHPPLNHLELSGESNHVKNHMDLEVTDYHTHHESIGPRQLLRDKRFYELWCTAFLITGIVFYFSSIWKAFAQNFITNDHFLVAVGATAAVFNASGRIVWGHLLDISSYRGSFLLVTGTLAIEFATLDLTRHMGQWGFGIWVLAIFCSFSGLFSIIPSIVTHTFGPRYAGANIGLVNTSHALSGVTAAILSKYLTPVVGWLGMFLVMAAFAGTAFLITLVFPGQLIFPCSKYCKCRCRKAQNEDGA